MSQSRELIVSALAIGGTGPMDPLPHEAPSLSPEAVKVQCTAKKQSVCLFFYIYRVYFSAKVPEP